MIYQELNYIPDLSIEENIFMGRFPSGRIYAPGEFLPHNTAAPVRDMLQEERMRRMKPYKGFDENLRLDGKVAVITARPAVSGMRRQSSCQKRERKLWRLTGTRKSFRLQKRSRRTRSGLQWTLTDYEQVEKAFDAILKEMQGIDIVCNIAGLGSGTAACDISPEEYLRVINVNLNAVFYVCQIAGKIMIRQGRGGRIINMSSQAGVVALYGHVAYSASKAD